ncbi:MAG: hypothetical protein QOJ32_1958 [Frankiaceae bacterium]|nr:hypothetical protein [Frankiaceae bacterium]
MTGSSARKLARVPLRVRLVLGFAGAMLTVLVAAGAFVFWRVQYALDARLADDLTAEAVDLQRAASVTADPAAALAAVGSRGRDAQLLDRDGAVLTAGAGVVGRTSLLSPSERVAAQKRPVRAEQGSILSPRGDGHLRIRALPVTGRSPAAVAVAAVRMDQRDEALRELLLQLAVANLVALGVASVVGYRLARAALQPVERYRTRAEQIADGATRIRLDVPPHVDDEVSRLGHTLNHMLAAQEHASEQQQQFIDAASHELRTPLTVLSAEVELALRRPRTAEEYQGVLARVAEDARRLVELADELLVLGAQGTSVPQATAVEVADLLADAARRARSQLPDDRVARVQGGSGLWVQVDPALLGRAMGNVVDNAVRYGAADLTLDGCRPAPGVVAVTVHDSGEGMPAEFLPHAVERFRQAGRSRSGPGHGLGLALVDAVVTAHRGQLRICSNGAHHHQPVDDRALAASACRHPDAGTTVTVLLREV